MKFTLQREELLTPLQLAIGVVERRQTLPILANVLLRFSDDQLSVTGTDLEVELIGRTTLQSKQPGNKEITVPGRKLLDICKTLPDEATITLEFEKDRLLIKSGRSRFSLSTLPAEEFPFIQADPSTVEIKLPHSDLHYLIQRTHFAMAQQDVRYYLNGMLLEVKGGNIRTVATDGHRLALNSLTYSDSAATAQALLPYKGVHELLRLISGNAGDVTVGVSANHIRVESPNFTFISKLIDGSFPSYERVVPKNSDKHVILDRHSLKQTLQRASVLTNEKFRGVRFHLENDVLQIQANNPEQEEAEEEMTIDYQSPTCELGFNVDYIIDVLNTISNDNVVLSFTDNETGVLVQEQTDRAYSAFVIMPLRL
ncbi:MAG: DNA polymerase III subunit beta [Gammaproteobacteria bacterium]|nr:DNA polymerase III subunit beta [Gammaproteobacteria bacterium]